MPKKVSWSSTAHPTLLVGAENGAIFPCGRLFWARAASPAASTAVLARVIRPLEPKALIYVPGAGNGYMFGYTAEESFALAQRVVQYARNDFPDMPIYIGGFSTWKSQASPRYEKYKAFEGWLRELAETVPGCKFLDLDAREEFCTWDVYVEDKIHFNAEGYRLYAEFFREALKDELDQF